MSEMSQTLRHWFLGYTTLWGFAAAALTPIAYAQTVFAQQETPGAQQGSPSSDKEGRGSAVAKPAAKSDESHHPVANDSVTKDPTAEAASEDPAMLEARELFIEGAKASEELRWDDAAQAFRKSYRMSKAPSALFNLGLSLRALGKHLEARNAFESILSSGNLPAGADYAEIDRLRRQSQARIANLRLKGLLTKERYGILLDGAKFDDSGMRPLDLETNSGAHTLVIRKKHAEPYVWNGKLLEGELLSLTPKFKPRARKEETPLVEKPWFWVVVVGAAAAAATAVALGVTLTKEEGLQPGSDNVVELLLR